jgi:hypothetical protein
MERIVDPKGLITAVAYRKNSFGTLRHHAVPARTKELAACLKRCRILEADPAIVKLLAKSLDITVVRIVLPIIEIASATCRVKLFTLLVALVKLRVLEISLVDTTCRAALPIVVTVLATERSKLVSRCVTAEMPIDAELYRGEFRRRHVVPANPTIATVFRTALISLPDCPIRLVEAAFTRTRINNLAVLAVTEIAEPTFLVYILVLARVAANPKVAVLILIANIILRAEPASAIAAVFMRIRSKVLAALATKATDELAIRKPPKALPLFPAKPTDVGSFRVRVVDRIAFPAVIIATVASLSYKLISTFL